MKAYIKPAVRVVEITTPLLCGSDTVEFRFSTQTNGEWEDAEERVME